MNRVNLAQAKFEYPDTDPEGFIGGMVRPGPDLGAKTTGVSSYELPPGQALCPYHYEWGEEEWLLVMEGRPTLRDPDGEHELQPMDLVFFARGPRALTRSRTTRPTRCASSCSRTSSIRRRRSIRTRTRSASGPTRTRPTAIWPGAQTTWTTTTERSVKKRSGPAGGPLLGEERYCFYSRCVWCEQTSPGRPSPSVPG